MNLLQHRKVHLSKTQSTNSNQWFESLFPPTFTRVSGRFTPKRVPEPFIKTLSIVLITLCVKGAQVWRACALQHLSLYPSPRQPPPGPFQTTVLNIFKASSNG
ncbi:hypothetical protein NPIL_269741 [Nephila pilipes]|uniref:Uncharacterized protein n=1 Tax=Nephila pilipes TaxID=299642 RepID=A0A8X6QAE7_NEPPI|nr:hypothetical protein NPIL_269741 [Nephila pilipes]